MWKYKSILVFPADRNGSGIRWTANTHTGETLRADTKEGMKKLITESKK